MIHHRGHQLFLGLSKYWKNSKYWDSYKKFSNCPKTETVWFYRAVKCPKGADGKANSVDPD